MPQTHAVGIDLGTTYSCLAYLNEHGKPVTLANPEGELATPSVVFFDGQTVVVGTEALRNAIAQPNRVVENAKRFIGDPAKRWTIDGRAFSPVDIATLILDRLLSTARAQIGAIKHAVITVPALFSEIHREATVEAGLKAGLERVDIINEPVAAALCHVLGTEGLWFTALAEEQRILVFDLGGGTFDLSLVGYHEDEVAVVASSGDLNLGGIDWNHMLIRAISDRFTKDFGEDPRSDARSLQALALEVETTKRSLTVRPQAALTCQHGGHRKTYHVKLEQFEQLTRPLVERTATITQKLLKDNQMGWAHVDVILTTGGASRMPMIRNRLKEMGGRTLNTSLSPDQSIAHGATYYAGMLLKDSDFARSILDKKVSQRLARMKQRSVNARGLGIMVRDVERNVRVSHYLIHPNTPLPASITRSFGTVIANQKRVHLHIVESPISSDGDPVELGACVIDDLSPNLPEGAEIAVTIRYDEQARVHVSARDVTGGREATTEIVREENVIAAAAGDVAATNDDFSVEAWTAPPKATPSLDNAASLDELVATTNPPAAASTTPPTTPPARAPKPVPAPSSQLDLAEQPVPLCDSCGEPLDVRGGCPDCAAGATSSQAVSKSQRRTIQRRRRVVPAAGSAGVRPPSDDKEILEMPRQPAKKKRRKSQRRGSGTLTPPPGSRQGDDGPVLPEPVDRPGKSGEEEFWRLPE